MVNASGSRDATEAAAYLDEVESENIPRQSQQKSYQKQKGRVWFSTCLLMYSVDRDIANKMAKYYKTDQKRYKWLDLFIKEKRSDETSMITKRSSLY